MANHFVPHVDIFNNPTFTKKDFDEHKTFCSIANYPIHYNNDIIIPKYDVKFVDKKLIKYSEIKLDDKFGQEYRKVGNEKGPDIHSSIKHSGWNLGLPPIAVFLEKDGTYRIHEGRTRMGVFHVAGFSNDSWVIADVYVRCKESKKNGIHAYALNNNNYPKGEAKPEDAVVYILSQLVDYPQAKDDEPMVVYRQKLYDHIVNLLSLMNVPKKQVKKVTEESLTEYLSKGAVISHTKSFRDWRDAKEHLYYLGVHDDKKYYYAPMSTDEYGAFKILSSRKDCLSAIADGKTIRLIPFSGSLDLIDPIREFYLTNIRVHKKIKNHLNFFVKNFSNGISLCKVEVYGTIPQCHELNDKYPMNKLILYKNVSKEEYNLYGEKNDD